MLPELLDRIDQIDVPAPVYRTAVRMARLADSTLSVTLTYEQARAITQTESDGTVRAHLHQLHAAGVLWFRRNEVIRVSFYASPAPDLRAERAPGQQNVGGTNTETVYEESERALGARNVGGTNTETVYEESERAPSARNVGGTNTETVDEESERAPSARNVGGTNKTRAERAKRAPGQQLLIGRLVGRQVGDRPTYLPGGCGGDGLTPEQTRTAAMLTDVEFGMDESTARRLAQQFSFEAVQRNAAAVLRDVQAGRVHSVYVLPSRLQRGGLPQVLDSDRASSWWRRHAVGTDADPADDLRSRYLPDEYAGIIVG
jgi:hypothetical protein